MHNRTLIRYLHQDPSLWMGKPVHVSGWVRSVRDQKQLTFVELNDGSAFRGLQLVLQPDRLTEPVYLQLSRMNVGTALHCSGVLQPSAGKGQPFELLADSLAVEGSCPPEYPLQPKRHTPEFLRGIAHLRPRTNLFSAVFRVRSAAAHAIHRFFEEQDFILLHSPIITASDAEGAGQMFSVTTLDPDRPPRDPQGSVDYGEDFFGGMTRLTVSGQLNAETFAMAFSRVYTFGPTFRAERSNTTRHAAEFWMVEPEMAFADLTDDMELAEELLRYVIRSVRDRCPDDMAFLDRFVCPGLLDRLDGVQYARFAHLTYSDAVTELQKVKDRFVYSCAWGDDLQTEHERFLTEELMQGPVFITDYPKDIKAFYMRQNEDGKTVAAMDCLVPGIGEIVGGSQREEREDLLVRRMSELGMDRSDYQWYLDLRRFGGTRHAGFGLGFERLIMYLTGVSNIRDVIPFPRTTGHAEF